MYVCMYVWVGVYLQTGQGEGRTLMCFDQSQPAIKCRFSISFETVMADTERDLKKMSFLQWIFFKLRPYYIDLSENNILDGCLDYRVIWY